MSVRPEMEIPERFRVARGTLMFDRFMNYFITVGGLAIIVAVFGIFVFILAQIWPLFKSASVHELRTEQVKQAEYVGMGVDEWAELPVLISADGNLTYYDLTGAQQPRTLQAPFATPKTTTAFEYNQPAERLAVGTSDGHIGWVSIKYRATYPDGGEKRVVEPSLTASDWFSIGPANAKVVSVCFNDSGSDKIAAAVLEDAAGARTVHAITLTQTRGLMGPGRIEVGENFDLTANIEGRPVQVLVPRSCDNLLVATDAGVVYYFEFRGGKMSLRQAFEPFGDQPDKSIALMRYLLGEATLVLVGANNDNRAFTLYPHTFTPAVPGAMLAELQAQVTAAKDFNSRQEAQAMLATAQDITAAGHTLPRELTARLWGQTKTFPDLPGPVHSFSVSARNKAFLLAGDRWASLRYSTTENVRWSKALDYDVIATAIGGKYDRLLFLDSQARLHFFTLDDHHPEAGFKAFFGKIWYEGQPKPDTLWESTGATDDFEPKLSMVPLLLGTLKGTFYAMFFALPIALLAAIYTSQFLKPEYKRVIKPTMEIMASLPSVVLGFLAAAWLAPMMQTRVPSFLLVCIGLPLSAALIGWVLTHLPPHIRVLVPAGYEMFVFVPVLFVVGILCWKLGPWFEQHAFVVTDPDTGKRVADFRLWWPQVTGATFDQRNSLVVGFMMGFAVIPIIFTIAEDSLSNVPASLTSGSLALGASRWQTAVGIVLPSAAAGIFSAVMIGLGRAVGETMIVVMATGNTPVKDWNIFSGMRTLSANVAVELPEAPHHSTLFRALFLGAMLLFLLTFAVNTVAEILRQRLRDKYKIV